MRDAFVLCVLDVWNEYVRCDLTADFSGGAVLSENTDAEDSVSASDQALGQGVPNDARGKYISPFMGLDCHRRRD